MLHDKKPYKVIPGILSVAAIGVLYGVFHYNYSDNAVFVIVAIVAIILCISFIVFHIIFAIISTILLHGAKLCQTAPTIDDIDSMDGHAFEYWCADLLRHSGYTQVEVTRGSGDQGVDILAYKAGEMYAIQCKRYNHKLGNKPVQEVYSGKAIYGCSVAVVMTNNYFTEGGKLAARALGVKLWDRSVLLKMEKHRTWK